jgi:DNA-3-methyladenine glycosylase (3mg)
VRTKKTEIIPKPLPLSFYTRKSLTVARELLGKTFVRIINGKILSGLIVETEAYTGRTDPASHSYKGKTKRNEVMFNRPGLLYVYFIYGVHYCANATAGKPGDAHAVLIRAIEPLSGIEEMKKFRQVNNIYNLTSGPGKLCMALDISLELNGIDITSKSEVFIFDSGYTNFKISASKRIGISKAEDRLNRFFIYGNPFVTNHKFNKLK